MDDDILIRNNFPSRLLKVNFNLELVKEIRDYIDNFRDIVITNKHEGLYLYGKSDTGKSTIAVLIVKELVKKYLNQLSSIYYVNFSDLMDQYFNVYTLGQKERDYIDRVADSHLVLLDDIGRYKISQFVAEKMYLILNRKYEKGWPLILTSNYTIEELCDRIESEELADAIHSRLKKMTRFVKVEEGLF